MLYLSRVVCALFKLFEWPGLEHTVTPIAIALAIVNQPMKLVSRKVQYQNYTDIR